MSIKILKTYGQVNSVQPPGHLRRYGVPVNGALDKYSVEVLRSALLQTDSAPMIEVMGQLEFEARTAMTIGWMTPTGGFLRQVRKFERVRVACVGCFAGYLGFTKAWLPERKLDSIHDQVPQLRFLPLEQKQGFSMTTSFDISRVGFRFTSDLPYPADTNQNRPSEPLCVGLIQQTPSGQIIIIGPSGPVSGGYRKLGVLIEADHPYMAQFIPKQEVEMIPVSMSIAREARLNLQRQIHKRAQVLRLIQQEAI